jgi:multidrug resistance protein, MATE family
MDIVWGNAKHVTGVTGQIEADGWRDEVKAMATLAWPLILANLTMMFIAATDVILIGRLGPHALAAAALGVNLAMAFNIFCLGLVIAGSPIMAAALGSRQNSVRDVRRTFRQNIWLVAFILLPILALLWNAEHIMRFLGQSPDLAKSATIFLHGYMWCQIPFLLFQIIRNFMAALERPGWALAVSIGGIFLNALLGWILIFGHFGMPALGLFGGGLASTSSWSLMLMVLVIILQSDRQFRRFHLFGKFWRADWLRFRQIAKLGLPIAITLGFEGTVFSAGVYFMGLIDTTSIAAHAIALQLASISFMVPLGISQATTVRIGYGVGKGDNNAIRRAGWVSFAMGVGFMCLMAMTMFAFPQYLIGIFIDVAKPYNAPVVTLATRFLFLAALFQIFDGAQVVLAGMLRGLQDTLMPMVFAGIGYWIIGLGGGAWLAFVRGWHGAGIWTGFVAGLAAVSIMMMTRWLLRERLKLLPV